MDYDTIVKRNRMTQYKENENLSPEYCAGSSKPSCGISGIEVRQMANRIWWENAFKVSAIFGLFSGAMIAVSMYAYSQDRDNISKKLDMVIAYIKEDIRDIKDEQIAMKKKISEIETRLDFLTQR